MYLELWYWTGLDPETGIPISEGGNYKIKNLSFSMNTDLTGSSLPINEYSCDVITEGMYDGITTDAITSNLYDDRGFLWAAWPVYKAVKISDTCMRVTFRSWINALEYKEMEETVYEGETAEAVMATIFQNANDYALSDSLKSIHIRGFAPAQTARERLKWLLFVMGAFIRDVYVDRVEIVKVDTTELLIPIDRTFASPSVDFVDWVTGLKITAYSFSRAASDEEASEHDNSYMFPLPWIATESTLTLTNPNAPGDAQENVIEIDGIYLVNSENVGEIATRLAQYWFNPLKVKLDVINNRLYKPGNLVMVYTSPTEIVTGYINDARFKFGFQARSTLTLLGCSSTIGAELTIKYTYDDQIIKQEKYFLPTGYAYSIQTTFIDQVDQGNRYIYRPMQDVVSGTMPDGGAVVYVPCELVKILQGNEFWIVLVWGRNPADLDSHFVGPGAGGDERFHISYNNKTYSVNGKRYAYIDVDDRSSYGPETTTIEVMTPGTYYFYVHDYTNKNKPGATALGNSGARVNIYKGIYSLNRYEVTPSATGIYWNVCRIDIDEKETINLTEINTYSDEPIYQ